MARLLDTLHAADPRRTPDAKEKPRLVNAAPVVADPPVADEDDASDIPFIEVGAAVAKMGNLKPARAANPAPTILPLNRAPAIVLEPPAAAIEDFPLFRITFQPLPFEREPADPADHRFARELVAFHQPDHSISEQYRGLMGELEAQLGVEPGKTLLFTAAHPSVGVTTVLLNLAISCARRGGTRVAVVDANFARPAMAERLGLAPSPGLREVLGRSVPLVWALQETGQADLIALAAGNPAVPATVDCWPLVLDQLKQRFDWVLVDAAEWGHPELPALAGTCAATYLILGQADLGAPELNDLLADIPRQGGRLRGYVLRSP